MSLKQRLKNDIAQMKEYFPKLLLVNDDGKAPSFSGYLDICDATGVYWDTFKVKINGSPKYPYGVPKMFELEGKIEKTADRHINPDESCCVSIDHVLQHHAGRGLVTIEYIRTYAYPFLANQLYFEKNGHYADKEYKHGFEGIRQFYAESLNIPDADLAITVLTAITTGSLPHRNAPCMCAGGKKYKNCHMGAVNFLDSTGKERIDYDLLLFKAYSAAEKEIQNT